MSSPRSNTTLIGSRSYVELELSIKALEQNPEEASLQLGPSIQPQKSGIGSVADLELHKVKLSSRTHTKLCCSLGQAFTKKGNSKSIGIQNCAELEWLSAPWERGFREYRWGRWGWRPRNQYSKRPATQHRGRRQKRKHADKLEVGAAVAAHARRAAKL